MNITTVLMDFSVAIELIDSGMLIFAEKSDKSQQKNAINKNFIRAPHTSSIHDDHLFVFGIS